jgi:hypothetical protein
MKYLVDYILFEGAKWSNLDPNVNGVIEDSLADLIDNDLSYNISHSYKSIKNTGTAVTFESDDIDIKSLIIRINRISYGDGEEDVTREDFGVTQPSFAWSDVVSSITELISRHYKQVLR